MGIVPRFEWEHRYPRVAAFRFNDKGKRYAFVMPMEISELDKTLSGIREIADVVVKQGEREILMKQRAFYPKHPINKEWISLILDDTLPDDVIMQYIAESYVLRSKSERQKKTS